MSRSALWRQEGNRKERERQADELFLTAVEEGRVSLSTVCLFLVTSWKGMEKKVLADIFFFFFFAA